MTKWEQLALYCEETYGCYVDWDERFFECPECGEPIYECDWRDSDYYLGRKGNDKMYCPVCENLLMGEEEEEEDE